MSSAQKNQHADELKKEVETYREGLINNYNCRMGDENDLQSHKITISNIFKDSPDDLRDSLLLIVYKVLIHDAPRDEVLTSIFVNRCFELVTEL